MDRKVLGRSTVNQSSSGCSSTQLFRQCCCWCFLGRGRGRIAVVLMALASLGLIRWLNGSDIAWDVQSASFLLSSMISEEAASTPKAVAVAPTAAPIVAATPETTAPMANIASAAVVSATLASIEPPVTLKYHGSNDFRTFLNHWWVPDASEYKGLCSDIQETQRKQPNAPVVIEFTLDCAQLFQDVVGMGTGNVIELLYVLRLQCYSLNATLHLSCPDASSASTAGGLVLPWLLGSTDTSSMSESVATISNLVERACGRDKLVPIGVFYRDMQVRLRSMVIALSGLPPNQPNHPSAAFAELHLGYGPQASTDLARNQRPIVSPSLPKGFLPDGLLPSPYGDALPPPPPLAWLWTEMDDVALHFRCGDLMNMAHPDYEFMTFNAYSKLISSEARSIGIITGPFDVEKKNDTAPQPRNQQERAEDTTDLIQDRCRRVVLAFVDYLQARHPNSRVAVRNGKKETVQSSYVRLVMANQTIVGTASTFAIFPAIASFGTGYLSSAPRNSSVPARTRWMIDEFGQAERPVDNVVLVEDYQRANVGVIKELWETQGAEGVVAWFST